MVESTSWRGFSNDFEWDVLPAKCIIMFGLKFSIIFPTFWKLVTSIFFIVVFLFNVEILDFFEILGVGIDIANQDIEGIEHHLNPKTIRQLRKFITFLKSNPKITDEFNEF